MPAVTAETLTLPRLPNPDPQQTDRPVLSLTTAPSGLEGEGFPVRRAFAGVDLAALDPFVHMDQMGEVDYAPGEPKGTPWHPHRGFETVTYMIDGIFQHQDSNGGGGLITDGDTQWMTAGAGLLGWVAGEVMATDPAVVPALRAFSDGPVGVQLDRLFGPIGLHFANGGHGAEVVFGLIGIAIVLVVGAMWRKSAQQKHAAEHAAKAA